MNDLNVSLGLTGMDGVVSQFESLKKLLAETGSIDVSGNLQATLATANTQLEGLSRSVGGVFKALAKDIEASAKAGSDAAVETVRGAKQKMQAEYEAMRAMGAQVKPGALANLSRMGVSLFPDDSQRLADTLANITASTKMEQDAIGERAKLRAASAGTFTLDDYRHMMGQPSQAQAALFSAQLKAGMLEDDAGYAAIEAEIAMKAKLRAASAGTFTLDDYRHMMGQPSVAQATLFSAQLKAKMLEDAVSVQEAADEAAAIAKLRAASAGKFTLDDYRHMMGQPSQAQAAAFAAQLKAGMAEQQASLDAAARRQVVVATAQPSGPYSVSEGAALGSLRASMEDGIPATNNLRGAKTALRAEMHQLHSAARGLTQGFGQMWMTYGAILPLIAGAAVSNAAAQALKIGADVGQSLAKMQHLAGDSTQEISALNKELLNTAASGPFGPAEVAKSLEVLALAGLSAKEQLQALKPTLDFSVAGGLPIEKAAESLIAISSAFGYQARDMSVVSDIVAKSAAISMSTVEGMSASFKVASVVAQQYGVSLTDVAAGLSLMANVGIKNQAAGTAVKEMFNDLIGKSAKARDVLKNTLNFSAFSDDGKTFKTLTQSVTELSESFLKLNTKAQLRVLQDMAGERGAKGFATFFAALRTEMTATGASGEEVSNKMKEVYRQLEEAPGFTAIAAIGMASSTLNQLKQTASTLQVALVEAFQEVEPAVLRVTLALQDVFKSEEFKSGVSGLVSAVARVVEVFVKHIDIITTAVKLYLVYAAASAASTLATTLMGTRLGGLAVSALAAGLSMTNYVAATQVATVASAELAIGSAVASTAIGSIAVASEGAVAGLTAMNLAAGILGVLATLATAAYVAYQLFSDTQSESDKAFKGSVADKKALTEATVKGLDAEIGRLELLIASKGDEKKATEAAANATRQGALDNVVALGAQGKAHLEAARSALINAQANKTVWDYIPGIGQDVKDQRSAELAAVDAQIAEQSKETFRSLENLQAKFLKVSKLSKDLAVIADGRKRQGTPSGDGTYEDKAKGGSAAGHMQSETDNIQAQLKARNASELAMKKSELADELSVNTAYWASITNGQSAAMIDQISIRRNGQLARAAELRAELVEYEAAAKVKADNAQKDYDKAKAANKGPGADATADKNLKKLNDGNLNAQQELDTFRLKNANTLTAEAAKATADYKNELYKLDGVYNKLKDSAVEFWLTEADNTKAKDRKKETDNLLRYATPRDAAGISAAASETERFTRAIESNDRSIRKNQEAFDRATRELDSMYESLDVDATATEQATAVHGKLAETLRLEILQRDNLKKAMPGAVETVTTDATDKHDLDNLKVKDPTIGAREALKSYTQEVENMGSASAAIVTKSFKGMEDALVSFVTTGKMDFASLTNSIIADMVRMAIQQSITAPLAKMAMSFLASANGNVFDNSPSLSAFSGGVYDKPQTFAFAQGAGVFAEAGPEAIMPLSRGANGKLGVQSTGEQGGGNTMVVNIVESKGNGGKQEHTSNNGVDTLTIMVEQIKSSIAGDISRGSGAIPAAMSRTYGVNRTVGAY